MATFPLLKTNAVAQYPASRTLRFRNQVVRFVDGTEQRYQDSAGALHQWTIRLNQLDAHEIAAVEAFFTASEGRFTSFTFTDPWDGQQYPNCSLAIDELQTVSAEEMRGMTCLTIMENRG